MGSRVLGILVLVLAVIILISTSAFIVKEQELALRVQIQSIIGKDYKPGLHFKVPFIDDVVKFDKRVLTRRFDGEQFLTSESQGLTVDYYIKWRISDAEQFYQSTSGGDEGRAESLVGAEHPGRPQERGRRRTLRDIVISDRNEITGEFMARSAESTAALRHPAGRRAHPAHRPAGRRGLARLREHETGLRGHRAHAARRGRPRIAAHPLDRRTPAHRAGRQGQCRRATHPRRGRIRPPRASMRRPTTAIPSSTHSIAVSRPTGIRWAARAT